MLSVRALLKRSTKCNKRKVVSGSRVTLPVNFACKPGLSYNPLARVTLAVELPYLLVNRALISFQSQLLYDQDEWFAFYSKCYKEPVSSTLGLKSISLIRIFQIFLFRNRPVFGSNILSRSKSLQKHFQGQLCMFFSLNYN